MPRTLPDLSPLRDDQLADTFRTTLRGRRRTVWDARGLLSRFRDKLIELRVEDGQSSEVRRYGRYRDVVHSPRQGFALVVRGLMAARSPALRRGDDAAREITTLPVHLIGRLPDPFRFLKTSPTRWPMPPVMVACSNPSCGFRLNTGRFCTRCGVTCRSGWEARFPGEGFAAMQSAIRDLMIRDPSAGREGSCGGVVHRAQSFCGKCGRGVEDHG